jgi:hypothetical protein
VDLSNNDIIRIAGFVTSDPALLTIAGGALTHKECSDALALAIDKVVSNYGDPTGQWRNLPTMLRPMVLKMTAMKLMPHIAYFPKQFQNVITTVARM